MDAKRIAADGLFLALALVVSYIEVKQKDEEKVKDYRKNADIQNK